MWIVKSEDSSALPTKIKNCSAIRHGVGLKLLMFRKGLHSSWTVLKIRQPAVLKRR